jgi:hypothetical protein
MREFKDSVTGSERDDHPAALPTSSDSQTSPARENETTV